MEHSARLFQYSKGSQIPILLKVVRGQFDEDFFKLLKQMNFSEIAEADGDKTLEAVMGQSHARILNIKLASPIVTRQISKLQESDKYGAESVIPRDNYRVYRYKGKAMMVYSNFATNWELGCFKNFGNKENLVASRMVLNRFLAMALAPLGIGGFWGVTVDEGVVLLRAAESLGEAVYIDFRNYQVFSPEGANTIGNEFTIIKLDSTLKRERNLSKEEVYGMLSIHTTFLDYTGLTTPLRQVLYTLSAHLNGAAYPKNNFKPRLDLEMQE